MLKENTTLLNIINAFSSQKLLVIGDAMLDSYLDGTSERLSREAPVPVVTINQCIYVPGGAANTAVNVHSLGAQVAFLSVVGGDDEGDKLLQALQKSGVPIEHVLRVPGRLTLSKQRVLAGSQMLVRFDQGSTMPLDSETETRMIERLEKLFSECDALLISDYNYGVITPRLIAVLRELQRRTPRLIVVDSKHPQDYRDLHVTAIKPNYEETVSLLQLEKLQDDEERIRQIQQQGRRILDLGRTQIAAITLDRAGALVFHRDDERPYRTYANPQPNSQAAGAGDTFVSILAASLAAGAHMEEAAELASAGAAIVVSKNGTAVCFAEELKDYFLGHEKFVTDMFQLTLKLSLYRRMGRKIVFTNGCFDILHRGHITYLNRAKSMGDVLIVGINSDDSVRRLKGSERPINTLEDRALVLAALSSIDHIIPFENDTPHELIRIIRPDIFVKGGDYTLETLPEADLVTQLGGKVHLLPYLENRSTSSVIEKIRGIVAGELVEEQSVLPENRK